MAEFPRSYRVSPTARKPLLDFILNALRGAGCRILFASTPDVAPFRITFELPSGERRGIVAYAFLANSKLTRNRPGDEHRFQLKYGPNDKQLHELWQDPFGLYTTILCGINVEEGFFVGADPILHNPTRMFISIEFKQHNVDELLSAGWHAWERESRRLNEPVEVLVGGKASSFLRYVGFEREAIGEDQGHRHLLAENSLLWLPGREVVHPAGTPSPDRMHALTQELCLSSGEVLNLIADAPRLKMAVRGWVAEEHLYRALAMVRGVTECSRIRTEGGADIALRFGGVPLEIECKNVLRLPRADGTPRLDFQRTRTSKSDPCSRFYSPEDFDVVAACLHARTQQWEFKFLPTHEMDPHKKCQGRLSNLVQVDKRWSSDAGRVLGLAAARSPG